MLELVNYCRHRLSCSSMAETIKRAPPAQEAWGLMGRLFWEMRPRMLRVAAESGLTPPQLFALRALDPDHPVPMRELASQLHCDSSNVTGLVDGLAAQGLVERREAEHDRRLRMLVVTERGSAVRARLKEAIQEPPEPLAALSADDQRDLRDILRRELAERPESALPTRRSARSPGSPRCHR
jgi:MarR family transcriptional regulator, organic hydroperoxide resistance regulator